MQLVESLVAAVVREDGDALVMHVGEKPTVMTGRGPVLLPSGPLTLAAMADLLRELLPPEAQQALDEFGAVEADLPHTAAGGAERFTVVAARGGDDIWIELRRQRVLPFDLPAPDQGATVSPASSAALASRPDADQASGPRSAGSDRSGAPEPSATVLPLARGFVKADGRRTPSSPRLAGLDRLLRLAAARGAETLYLFSQARPSIRVDGEIGILDAEPVLGPSDVDSLLLEALPDPREAKADGTEWIVDIPEVGPRALRQLPRSPRPGRCLPDDSGARDLGRPARAVARNPGALCASPRGWCWWPARGRAASRR